MLVFCVIGFEVGIVCLSSVFGALSRVKISVFDVNWSSRAMSLGLWERENLVVGHESVFCVFPDRDQVEGVAQNAEWDEFEDVDHEFGNRVALVPYAARRRVIRMAVFFVQMDDEGVSGDRNEAGDEQGPLEELQLPLPVFVIFLVSCVHALS